MEKLGTDYGGWWIQKNNSLNENSIVYSGGAGEDISFDLKLQDKYNCWIIIIDPTKKAIKHYEEVKIFYNDNNFKFTGNIQKDYIQNIKNLNIDFNKIIFLDIGLYNKKDLLKFYKQDNPNYVSQSLENNMFGNNYDIIKVDTIKNIMNELNHNNIDLLKLEIEGSECDVLDKMLDDNILPKYLCIEFDLLLKNKDFNKKTEKIGKRLESFGYKILKNDNLNITFELI
ncbi:MAG: FkbM family methyltransferase [Planctomycetota bacterium]|jgi:FkbM family methyltransferase